MSTLLSFPVTAAQQQRDLLLGALVGLARSTVNEPKTEDTDHVLAAGLRLAAKPEADTTALERMRNIVETEKHRVAPNCANCTMRCGNTDNYDLARLWNAPAEVRTLKLELLAALFALAQRRSTQRIADEIRNDLFVLAETGMQPCCPPSFRAPKSYAAGNFLGKFTLILALFRHFFEKPLYKRNRRNYYIVMCYRLK